MLDHLIFSIGWTIIHSLWQGAVFVFLFVLFTIVFHQYGIRLKYILGVIVLFLFLLNALFTFTIITHYQKENPAGTVQYQHTQDEDPAHGAVSRTRYFEEQSERNLMQQSSGTVLNR